MKGLAASNSVLRRLGEETLEELSLVPVDVAIGDILHSSGQAETLAYFPTSAVLSVVSTMSTGESAEVAVVGRDGMLGVTGVLGLSDSATTSVVQVAGTCLRTTITSLRELSARHQLARRTIDRYTTALLVQVAQLSACHRLHPVGNRLPRWLLSLFDRIDGTVLRLSQQNIADMLGVHRPTIALELQRLHRLGAISYRYRLVRLADRARLEAVACECHAPMHHEYVVSMSASAPVAAATQQPLGGTDALEVVREIAGRLLVSSIREHEARELAETANEAKDRLLAIVSHQLKTPLQAVLGWCTLAQQPQPPAEALAKIERNARAQVALIDDLLDAAQIAAGTLRLVPTLVDPVSVVKAAFDAVSPMADAKRLPLRLHVPDSVPQVLGDAKRLQQVIVNVLMNSVEFTDAGKIDTEISYDLERVEIRIRDTGRGVPSELLPRVFDSFSQGDEAKAGRGGVGLGLTIARALVSLHQGTIDLASAGTGQGSLCTITLPRSAEASYAADGFFGERADDAVMLREAVSNHNS